MTKLAVQAQSGGDMPDITEVGSQQVMPLINAGALMDISDLVVDAPWIDQINESEGSVDFNDRVMEAVFNSKSLGKVSIGQGSTASDSASEVDLSGASVVAYSSVADLAGGLFFFDDDADDLSGIRVKDVFSNLDGMGRADRVRYDTPTFFGFTASASTAEDQQNDAALRWGAEMAGFQAGAAVAYSEPDGSDHRINGSASALHLDTGLNLTVAGFVRGSRLNVYSGVERIAAAS